MAKPITNKVKTGQIPVIKKELDDGVIAEANNDGTIYLDKDVKDGSPLAKEAIAHEMVHMDQMARGDLNYNDDKVFWKGKEYDRDDMNEGSKQLPWEKEAYNKTKNMKKSPNKYRLQGGAINTNKNVLMAKLRASADKTAAIGNAVGQVTGKIPTFDQYEDTKNKSKETDAVDLIDDKEKSGVPMKVTPITMKSKSPLHIETSETREFEGNLGDKSGTFTETKTTKKNKKESVSNFANSCYNEDGSKKAEGTVVNGILCSWKSDEDFDPESEYEEKTIYDTRFEGKKDKIETPGKPGRANMGYYESLDSKMGAGVRGRSNKRVNRKAQSANNKFTRMSNRGKTPINPKTGEAYTREEYVKNVAGAFEIPDAFVGKREASTAGSSKVIDAGADSSKTTYKIVETDEGKKAVAAMNKKNKSKAPFKMKGFSGFNKQ
tara:strand:+ start:105 stop:1406 length:1302 start_codon:yes stop_codon:yes gene_type:complete